MKNFLIRAASGLSVAAIIIAAILASKISYGLVVLIAALGGVYEFYTISAGIRGVDEAQNKKSRRTAVIMTFTGLFFSWLFHFKYKLDDLSVILPVMLFFYFVRALFSKSETPFRNIAWDILPVIYIVLPVMLLNYLYFEKGAMFVMAILFLIWFFDSMCYITGSLLGRHKLFERISPQKTIEGWVGGMILSLTLVFFYDKILEAIAGATQHNHGTWFNNGNWFNVWTYTNIQWLIIGFVTLVFATLGDLVESQLKRNIGIKDSGTFLPGHGGFLDRLDAILVAIPFVVLVVFIMDNVNDILKVLDFIN
jgi:phosphatidate cytidylyltransferase